MRPKTILLGLSCAIFMLAANASSYAAPPPDNPTVMQVQHAPVALSSTPCTPICQVAPVAALQHIAVQSLSVHHVVAYASFNPFSSPGTLTCQRIQVEASQHITVQALKSHHVVAYASFNPFSTEQECCGGSGGWQSPYVMRGLAFTLLALMGVAFFYRLKRGRRLHWFRH